MALVLLVLTAVVSASLGGGGRYSLVGGLITSSIGNWAPRDGGGRYSREKICLQFKNLYIYLFTVIAIEIKWRDWLLT
jgi:hypothetical protein